MEVDLRQIRPLIPALAAGAIAFVLAGQQNNPLDKMTRGLSVEHIYADKKYGYSVRLPSGINGFHPAPPAPQHGFGVIFHGGSDDYLWVNAEYDALYLGTSARAADEESDALSKKYSVAIAKNLPSALSGLSAQDVILENRAGAGRVNYIHLIVAYRGIPGEVGIIYTIGLRQKAKSADAETLFSALVGSFKTAELSD
jgi:hypothetical protein